MGLVMIQTNNETLDRQWRNADRVVSVRVVQDSGPSDWKCVVAFDTGGDATLADNVSQASAQAVADKLLNFLGVVTL